MIIAPLGNKNAEIAIVSDNLSPEDVRFGRGYSGGIGSALKEPLVRLGYNVLSDMYLTHFNNRSTSCTSLIRCMRDKKQGAEHEYSITQYSGFNVCKESLVTDLKSMPNLKYIVALGDEALYALTSYWGVRYRRGSVYEWTEKPGVLILAMENPREWVGYHTPFGKYVMGDIIKLRLGHKDLQKLKKGLKVNHPTTQVAPDLEEVIAYINKCKEYKLCAMDIECSRDAYEVDNNLVKNISCFSLAVNDNTSISIPILTRDGNPYYSKEEFEIILERTKELCLDKTVKKVFHNAHFDTFILWHDWGVQFRNIADTMVSFGTLYPDFPKGLNVLTSILTDIPYYKDEGKEFIKLNSTGYSFWRYNALDSAATVQCYVELERLLKKNNLHKISINQNNLCEPLLYMMKRGLAVNEEEKDRLTEEAKVELEELELAFERLAGKPINLRSSKQIKEYFYGTLGLPPYKSRKTGKPTTDEKALKRMARKGIEEANILLRHREVSKFLSSYLTVSLKDDNRLRGQFKPYGTTSGRLSCAMTPYNTGLNVQTLPENFKRMVVADEGCLIYEVDLSKAENMIVAHIAPDHNMIKAFSQGIDLHSLTASLICGLSIEEVIRQNDNKIMAPIAGGTKTWRYWGKKANHGLNYGQGYRAFSLQNEITEDVGKFIVDRYFKAYPGVANYHRWVQDELNKSRRLVNLLGRQRVYLGRLDYATFKEAYSFTPQSTVADIINHYGLNGIWRERFGWARYVQLLNDVHDSIVYQIPIKYGVDYHAMVITNIQQMLEISLLWRGKSFVIPAVTSVGVDLADVHSGGTMREINTNQNIYNLRKDIQKVADELLA